MPRHSHGDAAPRDSTGRLGRAPRRGNNVFVSYAREDAEWRRRLQTHLAPLVNNGVAAVWDDTRIESGSKWQKEIAQALAQARVAILLVSADFLASAFIQEQELPLLLAAAERGEMIIIPIIVAPCLLEKFPNLGSLQAANPLERPLTSLSSAEQDDVLVAVARRVEDVMRTSVEWRTRVPFAQLLIGAAAALGTLLAAGAYRDIDLPSERAIATQVVPMVREVLRVADDLNTASGHYLAHNPESPEEFLKQLAELNDYILAFNQAKVSLDNERASFLGVLNAVRGDGELRGRLDKVISDSSNFEQGGYPLAKPAATTGEDFRARRNELLEIWGRNRIPLHENIKQTKASLDQLDAELLRQASSKPLSCAN